MSTLKHLALIVIISIILTYAWGTARGTSLDVNCNLPQYPRNGKWFIFNKRGYLPGQEVPLGTILLAKCNAGHALDGNSISYCNSGVWSNPLGQCLKTCPDLYSTKLLKVTCISANKITNNCIGATDGTFVRFQCANYYEDIANKPLDYCWNGTWDSVKPSCVPVCGKKLVEATTLIINGTVARKGDYPWQIALYTAADKVLICGGSLISQRVVITAAHCVTDRHGSPNPKDLYLIAAGKYYRSYSDPRDTLAQFSTISDILVPNSYKGAMQHYEADIAILISSKYFVFSELIQPICIDYGMFFENDLYNPQKTPHGWVSGWGYTQETSSPSETLRHLKVPPVTSAVCTENLPEDYESYVTFDKLCAGFYDQGTSVCNGDSGGGLIFKHGERYYLTGIVSLSPRAPTENGGCNSQQIALYTRIANYIKFIYKIVSKHRSKIGFF